MADLSAMTGPGERVSVRIEVPAHWADHHVMGRAVLPAVEAMQLLTRWTARLRPGAYGGCIGQAAFDKFLDLPAPGETIDAFCDLTDLSDGAVRAALATRRQAKSAAITRTIIHAQVLFESNPHPVMAMPADMPAALAGPCFSVAPQALYNELVPFGPAYRNISRSLELSPEGALAFIQAPFIEDGQTDAPLGSPFVPDAAFHAACVWSQRFADVVAFPVGIDERRIINPTQPGGTYIGRILPVHAGDGLLVFDILILDMDGGLYESLKGVRMRDISGGRLRPPGWVAAVPH
jgi:hypothetical protein